MIMDLKLKMTNQTPAIDEANLLELLFNSMPFSYVFWKNTDGVYLGASTNQLQLFDTQGKGFIGKTIFEIIDDYESAKVIDDTDKRIMQEGIPLIIEETVTTPRGEKKVFLSQKQPVRDNKNKVIGLIGFSIDITERKQLEEELRYAKEAAEAANNAKTEFLANMRHDIRTPLTGIVGFADILKLESENPKIREYAENLVVSSRALLHILDDVLESIRVSTGEIPHLQRKFDLHQLMQQIINLNQAKAAQKNLYLKLNLDKDLPIYVIGDKVRLHRIALELITNALNFTNHGHVILSVLLAKQEDRNLVIKLIVEDTGIGIPTEKQQEIYVQFKRLSPSYQGIYKGVGLGLSVVKQFIDELEGEIYVRSEIKKGTSFTCVIPLKRPLLEDNSGVDTDPVKPAEPEYELQPHTESKATPNKHHILLIEDNPIASHVAQSLLKQLNVNVSTATTGTEAIQLCESHTYDLIFMDIGLPDIDGYEVTRRIRNSLRKTNQITPIVALTAHIAEEHKRFCIDAGMNAVHIKPLTLEYAHNLFKTFLPERSKKGTQQCIGTSIPSEIEALSDFPLLQMNDVLSVNSNQELAQQMLRCLINDSLPQELEALSEAYRAQDRLKMQQIAHKIKGGAVYTGTIRLKIACQNLEARAKNCSNELLDILYQQTVEVIKQTIKTVQGQLMHC